MGDGNVDGDAQHLVAVNGKGSGTDHGITEEENDKNINKPVKEGSAVSEGMINCTPEPSAPPLQVGSELETTAAAALPCLPPYSAVPLSQYAYASPQPQVEQCATGAASPYEVPVYPPPYNPVPPNHPQQPLSSGPQQTFMQGVGAQANIQTQGGVYDFLCAVCKHKSKYRQLPGQRISIVKCPKCKEYTVCSKLYVITCVHGYRPILPLSLSPCPTHSKLELLQRKGRRMDGVASAIASCFIPVLPGDLHVQDSSGT